MASNRFPIVGIGASAGGTEALAALFDHIPPATGLAFVVVTHLPARYESVLPEIIGRHTRMPVVAASDGDSIAADTVYCCPADQVLRVADSRIQLIPRVGESEHKPIDIFLSSLGDDQGEAAVGILLSGASSDGSLGVKAIKERGGLTIAQGQDGSAPLHATMPDTAIASGMVDLVLSVEAIGERLVKYAAGFREVESHIDDAVPGDAELYQAIYRLLLKQVGHDFSGYKTRTFHRRVRRRMNVLMLDDDLAAYVERLRADSGEVNLLFRDLLIGVTNFFRDPEAFEALEREIIPRLFEGRGATDTVRIWVPGCATGEEVYSLAILVRERLETMQVKPKVQIFATDIDESALAIARSGRYPSTLVDSVSPERLQRFFTGDGASYSVSKSLRDLCVFSPHSVLRNPPFSRIDLISCRNLLIYFGTQFQAQVIPVFHFALRPGGYLFLGTSENVTQHADLFVPVEKKQRIFQRRDQRSSPLQISSFAPLTFRPHGATEFRRDPAGMAAALRRAVDSWVIDRHAPAHVVVNREGDILHYSARTGKYLEPAVGLPNRQLLSMARRGLRVELRAALREVVETRRPVERRHIVVEIDDRRQLIDLNIEPFDGQSEDPLFLVLFRDVGQSFASDDSDALTLEEAEGDLRVERLEHELRDTRDRLQATIEEYETAVEELKSSNEELQSVNEELQSTNEELETSKEELQSLNEELHTVNAELNAKVEEVDRANADLRNIFESTRIATVFLDDHLVIRGFTPAVTEIFNLISTDRGRPLTDIVSHLEDGEMSRDVQAVLERGDTIERNLRRKDGLKHYLMRILPYRGTGNRIEGVLVTFVDVTNMVKAEQHQRTLVDELNHRVRNMLTIVNAIAQQTLKQSRSPQAFAEAFSGRIQAMGSAYQLVSRSDWTTVDLDDVVGAQIDAYRHDADRMSVSGPRIQLNAAAALAMSLIMHELATNALKHGAMQAGSDGKVTLTWSVQGPPQGQFLVIEWREQDGPKVKKPSRRGFGSGLIEREMRETLGGTAELDYAEDGLHVTFTIPLDRHVISVSA